MKALTREEIKFVKETHFTPTVYQCDQFYLTTYTDERCDYKPEETYRERKEAYVNKWLPVIRKDAKERYNVDLDDFLDKNLNKDNDDCDGISLEYLATYLFYCFFTKTELEKLTNIEALNFLQDYRYYNGFRKWYSDCSTYIQEAIEVHEGKRVFYLVDGVNVWNEEADAEWLKDKKDKILKV